MSEEVMPILLIQVPSVLIVKIHQHEFPDVLTIHDFTVKEHGSMRIFAVPFDVLNLYAVSVKLEVERVEVTVGVVGGDHRKRSEFRVKVLEGRIMHLPSPL